MIKFQVVLTDGRDVSILAKNKKEAVSRAKNGFGKVVGWFISPPKKVQVYKTGGSK